MAYLSVGIFYSFWPLSLLCCNLDNLLQTYHTKDCLKKKNLTNFILLRRCRLIDYNNTESDMAIDTVFIGEY